MSSLPVWRRAWRAPIAAAAVATMMSACADPTTSASGGEEREKAHPSFDVSAASVGTVNTINPSGGTSGTDGLKIHTARGALQIWRNGKAQIYGDGSQIIPADLQFILHTEGTLIGYPFENFGYSSPTPKVNWNQVSNTLTPSGSSWRNVEVLNATVGSNTYTMTVTTEYTSPEPIAEVSVSVTVPAGLGTAPQLYLAGDLYLDGSDLGPGKSGKVSGKRYLVQYQGPVDEPTAVGGLLEVDPFTSWAVIQAACIYGGDNWDECPTRRFLALGQAYPDSANSNPGNDAGVGAHWNLGTTAGTVTKQVLLYFGTEVPGPNDPELCAGAFDAFSGRPHTEALNVQVLGMSGSNVMTWSNGRQQARQYAWPGTTPTRCTHFPNFNTIGFSGDTLGAYWYAFNGDGLAVTGKEGDHVSLSVAAGNGPYGGVGTITSIQSDMRLSLRIDNVVELIENTNGFASIFGGGNGQWKLGNTVIPVGGVFAPGDYTFNTKVSRSGENLGTGYIATENLLIFAPTDKTPTLNPLITTTTAITSVSPSPATPGSTYTVSGTVTLANTTGAPGTLPGSVTVSGDGATCTDSELTATGTAGVYAFSCDLTAGDPGEYTLTADYADGRTTEAYDVSEDTETQTVEEASNLPVIATTGGGIYSTSSSVGSKGGSKSAEINFGHTVQMTGSRNVSAGTLTTSFTGQLQWLVSNQWRFNGSINSTTTVDPATGARIAGTAPAFVGIPCPTSIAANNSAACARFSGTGTLEEYVNKKWVTRGTRTFTVTVYDGGTATVCRRGSCSTADVTDSFGLQIDSPPAGFTFNSEPQPLNKALNGGIVVRVPKSL